MVLIYTYYNQPIRDFQSEYYDIDCLPVGQRLPVRTQGNLKSIEIIESILDGESIGMITLVQLPKGANRQQRRAIERLYKKESVDGGHRKRAIWAFLNNKFKVKGLYFQEMSKEIRERFLDTDLSFTL